MSGFSVAGAGSDVIRRALDEDLDRSARDVTDDDDLVDVMGVTAVTADMSLKCAWIEGPKSIDTITSVFVASPTSQTILARKPRISGPRRSYPIPIGIDGLDLI